MTHFIFNEQYYEQVDGLAMGSPLSATLANVFLSHHEQQWINNCPPSFKPKYYKRYVDDTFLLFDNEEQANQFLDYMNNRHPRIKFTIETEENNKLPFLDLLISKRNNTFDLSIYRKPTFTNLGVNFISACYENFKMNTFNTLFFRAYKLSSTYEAFHKEICFLNNFF